ncbi:hypothetical protein LPICM02_340175 [Pseudolactococcus piscium]|nr:hypothetical protein LPICM02_340175 [Lactococcus piscium]
MITRVTGLQNTKLWEIDFVSYYIFGHNEPNIKTSMAGVSLIVIDKIITR